MLCRLDRHIILGRIMFSMKMHFTYCVVLNEWWCIALGRTIWILGRMHCIRTYSADFWENTILGRIVRFLSLYCTRTYSTIFDFVLYSDVQYDFCFCTILGRIVRFLILYYTRTYSTIFILCTVLGHTVRFWNNAILRRIAQFLNFMQMQMSKKFYAMQLLWISNNS